MAVCGGQKAGTDLVTQPTLETGPTPALDPKSQRCQGAEASEHTAGHPASLSQVPFCPRESQPTVAGEAEATSRA